MLDSVLDALSGSSWTYALVFALAALDVLLPLIPGETALVIAGVLAGSGELDLVFVIVAGAAGAILGDNVAYVVGRVFGSRLIRRFARGAKAQRRVGWAEDQITERGGALLITARFIPGGRTAATLAAGSLQMPWLRFLAFDLLAGLVWACFAGLLGYFGGQAFEDDPGIALLVAFSITLGVTALIEVVRARRGAKPAGPA